MKKKQTMQASLKTAEKIFDLAKKLNSSVSESVKSSCGAEMSEVIYGSLLSGDDAAIFESMTLATDFGDEEVFTTIVSAVEDESSCADLEENTDSKLVVSHLFAIPLVVELPLKGYSPVIEDGAHLRALEQSIKDSKIADGYPEVHIINYLYTASEIVNSTPSDIHKMTHDTPFRKPGRKKDKEWNFLQWNAETNTVESIQQSEVPKAARIDSNVVLRYLIGTFSNKEFIDPFETAYDSPEDSAEFTEFTSEMADWQIKATDLIHKCLGKESEDRKLAVGALDTFYLATRLGEEDYKQSVMILQMNEALHSKGLSPRSTRALIAPFGRGVTSEIRISLLSLLTSELTTGLVYSLGGGEDYDSTMERISHQLLNNGVFSIEIVSELQNLDDPKFNSTGFLLDHPEVRNSYDFIEHDTPRVLH